MSSPVHKKDAIFLELIIFTGIVFLLAFSSININQYLSPKKVLGIQTIKPNIESQFWQDFLTKYPDYIPGWIEIGRFDVANKIDPNYIKP